MERLASTFRILVLTCTLKPPPFVTVSYWDHSSTDYRRGNWSIPPFLASCLTPSFHLPKRRFGQVVRRPPDTALLPPLLSPVDFLGRIFKRWINPPLSPLVGIFNVERPAFIFQTPMALLRQPLSWHAKISRDEHRKWRNVSASFLACRRRRCGKTLNKHSLTPRLVNTYLRSHTSNYQVSRKTRDGTW